MEPWVLPEHFYPDIKATQKKPRTETVHTPPHAMLITEEAATQAVHAITQLDNIPTEILYQETIYKPM
eukprot:1620838-Ditylum_brightwellii.AAC.1